MWATPIFDPIQNAHNGFRLPELLVSGYGVVGLGVASTIIIAKLFRASNLGIFPTVGSNNWLGSWWAGLKFLTNAQNLIQEGYEKYKPAPFKVAEPSCWTIILSDRKQLEELARASVDEFSLVEAIHDQVQIKYTLGHEVLHNPYHTAVLRSHLNRNIEATYPDIRDEIITSFDEILDLRGNDWKSVPALSAIQNVVCRTSNRLFVGLPLCRNSDWIDLNLRYTLDIVKGGVIVGLFPEFMKPLAIRFLTNIPWSIARGVKLLGPIIEERQKCMNEHGNKWDDKPNDLLSWLMDAAEGPERTSDCLTTRVLVVNFAAIHTSSNAFTQALFYLAANPEYIQPLREEVQGIVQIHGWTKVAISKMRKVDSFLRECLRIDGLTLTTVSRKALTDFTFSDGTLIPKGTLVAAPAGCLHRDENFYANPEVFEPFRFADEDGKGQNQSLASATTEYLPFGLGRQACPGRTFAAIELKCMLAHVVVRYDVKLEDNATHPPCLHIGTSVSANPRARIMFRNREH